jgi:hypothetical protein
MDSDAVLFWREGNEGVDAAAGCAGRSGLMKLTLRAELPVPVLLWLEPVLLPEGVSGSFFSIRFLISSKSSAVVKEPSSRTGG